MVDKPRPEKCLLHKAASPERLVDCCFSFLRSFLRRKSNRKDYPLLQQARAIKKKYGAVEIPKHMLKDVQPKMNALSKRMLNGNYQVGAVRIHPEPKKDGKYRPIMVAVNVVDRIVDKSVLEVITPHLDSIVRNSVSFGGVPRGEAGYNGKKDRRNVASALEVVSAATKDKKVWMLKLDISKFFDSLDKKRVLGLLNAHLPDNSLQEYFTQWVYFDVTNRKQIEGKYEGITFSETKGIPQGSSLSPMIANLYMADFDKVCSIKGIVSVRYVDDLLFVCPSRRIAQKLRNYIASHCDQIGLELKQGKKNEIQYTSKSIEFLGYEHSHGKWNVPEEKIKKWEQSIREECGKLLKIARRIRVLKKEDTKKMLILKEEMQEHCKSIRTKLLTFGAIELPPKNTELYRGEKPHLHRNIFKGLLAQQVHRINGVADCGLLKVSPLYTTKKRLGVTKQISRWPFFCITVR